MFFITCFSKIETDKLGWIDMGAVRTFGYERTFEEAEESLNLNRCDMWEYLYDYAVVEKINYGIHPDCEERWFFKYNKEKDGFFRIEEPEEFKNYCNIAFG